MNKLPLYNLEDHIVRNALNRYGGMTDNNFFTKYVKSLANTNKWSKRKPTKYRNLMFVKGDEIPAQWQADNGLCGFIEESVIFGSIYELVEACQREGTFVYEMPEGGTEYPFRSGDYLGYNPEARNPIFSFEYEGQIYANDQDSSCNFYLLWSSSIDTESNLQMSDILPDMETSLDNYFFGIAVADSLGNIIYATGSTMLKDTSRPSVVLSHKDLPNSGTYTAYPMFVNPNGTGFVACPANGVKFKVENSADEEKLGWMEGTGKWAMNNGKFVFQGRLAYTPSWEGATVFIELQVNNENTGRGVEVALSHDSQTSDGKRYYMTYTHSIIMAVAEGEEYRLRVGYGSNWLNNDYLKLDEVAYEDLELRQLAYSLR